MACRIRLLLAIHNHQPIGNFDGVFEEAYQDSYAPFLEVLSEYPELPVALHQSGSLLEWLVEKHPEYIDRVRSLTDRGQIEILGGPFYEPILACIPRRDRIGQISGYSRYLEQLFGTTVRGMWVPERVWEQSFASDIVNGGIEYTLVDDFHFRSSGMRADDLHGYYLTEDEGKLLKIFPGSEKLRYTIPFQDPQATIDYLREIADRFPNSIVTFGDDGEKFGTWPGTKKHVYQDGWLRKFFEALLENSEWLKVSTLAEAVDQVAPLGKCYLADCSYREMTEWALSTELQQELHDLTEEFKTLPDWSRLRPYLRGGFWRNFRVKYPESNEMYARMLEVSERLERLAQTEAGQNSSDLVSDARRELYRAQCNCPYWHGAFGGLYLPHLRNAIYSHIIAADTLLEKIEGRDGHWVRVDSDDYNLDARKEIRLAGDRLVAYLMPSRGGHLYELDIRALRHNLLATLNRRPEPYHEKIIQHAQNGGHSDENEVASIHDAIRFKQPDLDKKIGYDNWPRKSLVDHFFQPGLSADAFRGGSGELGDFVTGVYETVLRRSQRRVEVVMSRVGTVGPYQIKVVKKVALDVAKSGTLEIEYELSELPEGVPLHFGVEFNFAGMPAFAPDRYYYDSHGRQLGQLELQQDVANLDRIGLVDEWLGLDAAVDFSQPASIWTMPIQTISQSEGGFELVHQSCAVVPHWQFAAPADGKWSVKMELTTDTSVAQARLLRETAAHHP